MPKRRMTPARKAQIRLWQAASHGRKRSYSNPIPAHNVLRGALAPANIPGSFGTVRRHKLGGKQYQKKSGGSASIASEAKAILSGTQGFRSQLAASMHHQGPALVPRIHQSWRTTRPSAAAKRQQAQLAKRKVKPSKVHGSGTGLSAAFRYKPPNYNKGR